MRPNIENFIGCDSSYRAASIVLYGAPYDSTTSYRPGARFGPAAIRHESYGLETYSPYQNADLTDFDVFDSGDLELCFGSSELALADIRARAEEILKDGKFPLLLGGEHLVTLGAVRAAVKKYPDLHIVHFDAHADLRDDYLGAKLSHACVLRRCHELVGDGHIHQFCIRSGDRAEFEFAAQHTELHKFDFTGLAELTAQLCESKVPGGCWCTTRSGACGTRRAPWVTRWPAPAGSCTCGTAGPCGRQTPTGKQKGKPRRRCSLKR